MSMSRNAMSQITAIMPVRNGYNLLPLSLPPLLAMQDRGELVEVIVVDDASTDDSAKFSAHLGAKVLHNTERSGPGAARNLASQQAKGDILWFVDADVVVHEDAARQVAVGLAEPGITAMFGSYDDRPASQNFASQYKNLVHHHYHQTGKSDATTFWSGCGAVQKKAFMDIGGYDAETYSRPSIEDIDLGCRLRDAGHRIILHPLFLSTHLKTWRFWQMVKDDFFLRAVPWSQQMFARGEILEDLNVSFPERIRAIIAGLLFISVAAALFELVSWWVPLVATGIAFISNRRLFALFNRRNGILFGIGGLLFHQVYYLYSGVAFGMCWLESVFPVKFFQTQAKPGVTIIEKKV
ncbi:MAG: glycosyltransferase [Gammaproteobacteria bacterium]|nr:glycosyltransferase [Gammaproteobacteria bacterium]